VTGQRRFWRGRTNPGNGAWELASDDGYFPAADLVGQTVNIGSKDGVVFDSVTVASFDDRSGTFTLTGGRIGRAYSDAEPRPGGNERLYLHDLARGYVHEENR